MTTTQRLDSITAFGTSHVFTRIRLADGHRLAMRTRPGAYEADAVFLFSDLTAPDTEAWENKDPFETFLTANVRGFGTLCLDVPVQAVRDLIEQHGGEHDDQIGDTPEPDPADYPLTIEGLFQAEQALRTVLWNTRDGVPVGAQAKRADAIRHRICNDILPALNGCRIDAAAQPEFAYMPMPEDADPNTLLCTECGNDDQGRLVLLTHPHGRVETVVCQRHHDDDRTRAWLAQQSQPEN